MPRQTFRIGLTLLPPWINGCSVKKISDPIHLCKQPGLDLEYLYRLSIVSGFDFSLLATEGFNQDVVSNGTADFRAELWPFDVPHDLIASAPIYTLVTGLLSRKNDAKLNATFWYLEPFPVITWLLLCLSLIVVTVLVRVFQIFISNYIVSRNNKSKRVLTVKRFLEDDEADRRTLLWDSVRFISTSWQLAVFLCIALYSAVLTSYMIDNVPPPSINRFEDLIELIEAKRYRIAEGVTPEYLQQMLTENETVNSWVVKGYFPSHLHERALKALSRHPVEAVIAEEDEYPSLLIKKLLNGPYVVTGELVFLETVRSCHPDLVISAITGLDHKTGSYVFNKDTISNLTLLRLNKGILELNRMDMYPKLTAKYRAHICPPAEQLESLDKEKLKIKVEQFVSIVILYAAGMLFAACMLICEKVSYCMERKAK